MSDELFIKNCLEKYSLALKKNDVKEKLIKLKNYLVRTHHNNKKVIISGNGGSAAIASHVAVDLTKQGGIRTINFNEPDLITCFANDYGYEHWLSKCIEFYADEKDFLILISSSGQSLNIINAAIEAKKRDITIATFTGFARSNQLSKYSDLSFWVDSKAYNIIENIHQIWLLIVSDMLKGSLEYKA